MAALKKVDVIAGAYDQMRISGLTVQPNPEELEKALERLEGMAAEFESRNICAGYNFTDEPDPDDDLGVSLAHKQAFDTNLAIRLLPDFNKDINPTLMAQASQSLSNLSGNVFQLRTTPYPTRQPRGSGNTLRDNRWQRFYRDPNRAPIGCDTIPMTLGNINDFFESWIDYLNEGETIVSFILEVSQGLRQISSSLTTPVVDYRVEATDVNYQTVQITITTSTGRVNVRLVNFNVTGDVNP